LGAACEMLYSACFYCKTINKIIIICVNTCEMLYVRRVNTQSLRQMLYTVIFLLLTRVVWGESSNHVCSAVFATMKELNSADRSFIFRCRPTDDCGGVGDRLGGVMGGAFYALKTKRRYKVIWPGWDTIFQPGNTNWTYDGRELGIPDVGGTPKVHAVSGHAVGLVVINPEFSNRTDVGVVNDLNNRQILNHSIVPLIEAYRHVFFHSNRGPDINLFRELMAQYNWPALGTDEGTNYMEVYRCVFESMFRPSDILQHSTYKAIGKTTVKFAEVVNIVEDLSAVSIAFHHRANDAQAESHSLQGTIEDKYIDVMVSIADKHRKAGMKMNLFFITNHNASGHKVTSDKRILKAFGNVFSQELSAVIHVNNHAAQKGIIELANHNVDLSLLQAMRDWWMMRICSVLIMGNSGFSVSATLFASTQQVRYNLDGTHSDEFPCGGRFC
jgi:hypothetical protein